MHNLSNQYFESQYETAGNQESGYELSPEFELGNEYSQEYSGESAYELSPEFELGNEYSGEYESYEMELAQELMEVSNEAEFFDWIKDTAKKAAGVAVNFLDSPTGQQATAALNDIAQKTLPSAGQAGGAWAGQKGGEYLGGAIAGALSDGAAAPIGKAIGGWAGSKLGGWGGQKAGQWAANKFPAFTRFATDTLRNLAKEVSVGKAPVVKNAIVKAASKHYPIILQVKGTLSARPVQGNFNGFQSKDSEFNNESYEYQGESNEGTFNEVMEMELASELLSIQSEAELDQFLGKLFKKAVGAVKNFAKSGVGKALGGALKGIAKKALPLAGGALGSFIPIPGVGTALGAAAGNAAAGLFELELEGLSAEDREFEVARAYVRFAGNAARRAARMNNMQPSRASRAAVIGAAKKYAPGLIARRRRYGRPRYPAAYNNDISDNNGMNNTDGGSWYRDGDKIVIEGAL